MTQEPNQQTTLKELFSSFIDDAEAKNLSKRTIKYYEYCFSWFTKTLPETTSIIQITKKCHRRSIIDLKRRRN
jgi:hypothetical protein